MPHETYKPPSNKHLVLIKPLKKKTNTCNGEPLQGTNIRESYSSEFEKNSISSPESLTQCTPETEIL